MRPTATSMTTKATRIILYSIDYSEGMLRELPYVRYFFERGLCHLAQLSDPSLHMVFVTRKPVPEYILNYHFREICQFNAQEEESARERLVFLTPQPRGSLPLGDLVLEDPDICEALRRETETADDIVLVNFNPSQSMDKLGEILGAAVEEGPCASARHWGSKSGSKEAFAKSGIPSPRGAPDVLSSVDDVKSAAARLAMASPPARQVVIKFNDASWGDGLGNTILDGRKLLRTKDVWESVESTRQSWESLVNEIERGGAIVEEYLPTPSYSPSGQGCIDANGTVNVRSTHEQILIADEYLGCIFPARTEFRPRIHEAIIKVGETLTASGIRGTFGVDFIGFEGEELLATEINIRKLGPSHVTTCVESAIGERLDPDGRLKSCDRSLHYVHRKVYRPETLSGLDATAAVDALRRRELLFRRPTMEGAILSILGALHPCGYIETTCLGASRARAEELDAQVEAALLDEAGVKG